MKKNSASSKSDSKPSKQNGSKMRAGGNGARKSESGDVVSLILRDHKPIKELILVLKDPDVSISKKQPAFAEFERTLLSHAKAEEESLYIQLKETDDLRTEGLEGDTEHAIAEQLMMEINESKGDDDTWMAKVKVLAELVDHHVKEEEKEVLKEVRKAFDAEKRVEIGEMYSQLLSKYRDENGPQKKYSGKENARAEYV